MPARQEIWTNYDEFYGHFRRSDLPALRKEVEAAGGEESGGGLGDTASELGKMFGKK